MQKKAISILKKENSYQFPARHAVHASHPAEGVVHPIVAGLVGGQHTQRLRNDSFLSAGHV